MHHLIVVAYPEESRAEEVLETLTRLEREDLAELDDACYVTRSVSGAIRLHQPIGPPPVEHARRGRLEALVSRLWLAPREGSTAPTPADIAAELGVSERFLRDAERTLPLERSAILVLIRKVSVDRLVPELAPYGGTVMQTAIAAGAEDWMLPG
jgi:uncharacterized membrane protein